MGFVVVFLVKCVRAQYLLIVLYRSLMYNIQLGPDHETKSMGLGVVFFCPSPSHSAAALLIMFFFS